MHLTTWEAHKKYNLSLGYLRTLLAKEKVKGRKALINSLRHVWLVDESSLKKYLKTDRKRGPKPSK